ncbi:GTP-binding protein YsxC [Asticcacaulis sp. AC460]|uniref:ribosome biogenesis GTP-binding protein YihA/YsxC n=1 Tax=Asticcacaulis sp. AC460 TaxID=1282360 RepID=UPI0003C3F3F8|nr:ribosome biogenesis GTP-binding protein YihA/YsxC [Asticcacaulis sp. AC460]ESQ90089.1 GTP-binding protein YsxC [Asticcacaulis sp. AC460]
MTESPYDDETLEAGRLLFARPATFVMGAAKVEQLPDTSQPEVAFAGRSNVGKSSLINAVVGMKALARASNEPGRTREVNFFNVNGQLHLVDLPGYGWAKASKVTVKKFQNLGRDYLRGRPNLKRAYLLIDARHGLKEVDKEPMDALDVAAVSYQIVLTKADKIKPAELAKVIEATQAGVKKRPAAHPLVLATSSEAGFGIAELRAEIMRVCEVTP